MKKTLATCLAILFTLALCACEKKDQDATTVPQETVTVQPAIDDRQNIPGTPGPGPGDPGDSGYLEWWGTYTSHYLGFSIDITDFTGSDFWVEICLLRDGSTVLAGRAIISDEDIQLAVLDDIGLYLYDDFSAIDIVASESSDWAHMRGQYMKIA